MRNFFTTVGFFLFFPILVEANDTINMRIFNKGLTFMHIPKCGGNTTKTVLTQICTEEFGQDALRITRNVYTSYHEPLSQLVAENTNNRPIITFLRNPYERAVSNLRFSKFHGYIPGDLNNLVDVKRNIEMFPNFCIEKKMFAPPGLDVQFHNMTDDKVNQCVEYALQNLAFIGEIDKLEESLQRLKSALNLKIDATKLGNTRVGVTPDSVEKITNPEVIAYLKEMVKWDVLIYEGILEGQRWRIAKTVDHDIGGPDTNLVQYILPSDFDPDNYLNDNPHLAQLALVELNEGSSSSTSNLVVSDFSKNNWKLREWAMQHYISTNAQLF